MHADTIILLTITPFAKPTVRQFDTFQYEQYSFAVSPQGYSTNKDPLMRTLFTGTPSEIRAVCKTNGLHLGFVKDETGMKVIGLEGQCLVRACAGAPALIL